MSLTPQEPSLARGMRGPPFTQLLCFSSTVLPPQHGSLNILFLIPQDLGFLGIFFFKTTVPDIVTLSAETN